MSSVMLVFSYPSSVLSSKLSGFSYGLFANRKHAQPVVHATLALTPTLLRLRRTTGHGQRTKDEPSLPTTFQNHQVPSHIAFPAGRGDRGRWRVATLPSAAASQRKCWRADNSPRRRA